jgi:peptidoglycan/LPS O-acetylase OafA/YrhL
MAPRRTFPLVHALRAVAALSVLLFHVVFKGYLAERPGSPLAPYFAHLDAGVSVFFVISAFVLYRPMVLARLTGAPPLDADAYGRRRLARIVPGYWVALILTAVAGASYAGYPRILDPQGAIAYFGFLQTYSPDTAGGGINVAWTLCVELSFYAFLPLWALGVRRLAPRVSVRSELVALGLLFAASVGWQIAAARAVPFLAYGGAGSRRLETLPAFLDQFAAGMALAVASVAWEREGAAGGRGGRWLRAALERRPGAGLGVAAVALWLVATLVGVRGTSHGELTATQFLAEHQLYTVIAVGLLVPAVFGAPGRGLAHRALGARGLAFGGTISYGIYLYHVPVLTEIGRLGMAPPSGPLPLAAWLAMTLVATVALAWASWRLVERPAMALAKRRTRVADADALVRAPAG